jgi:hypothetical protein
MESHHVLHWADGGASDVDNAALVCQRHHTTVHRRRLAARVRRAPDELGRHVVWDLTDGSSNRHLERLRAERSAHDPPPLTPRRLRSLLVAATSSDVDDQRWAELSWHVRGSTTMEWTSPAWTRPGPWRA